MKSIKGLRRAGATLVATTFAWLVVAVYAVHGAMPFNPVRLPGERWLDVRAIAPQGWAFFTRDPQEEQSFVFSIEGNHARRIGPTQQAAPSNAFGASRAERAHAVELSTLLAQIPDEAWQACSDAPDQCLARLASPSTHSLRNAAAHPAYCGAVGLALQKPVPWAWATGGRAVQMPSRVARVEILC